jgi:hypothetical protein
MTAHFFDNAPFSAIAGRAPTIRRATKSKDE